MGGQRWDVMSTREYQTGGETKTAWTKVGAAFTNRDGSIGVQLDALPLNGKLVLQIPMSREERQAKWQQGQGQRQAGGNQQRYRQQQQPVSAGNLFGNEPDLDDGSPFDNDR